MNLYFHKENMEMSKYLIAIQLFKMIKFSRLDREVQDMSKGCDFKM
jgi:hypothetical protein